MADELPTKPKKEDGGPAAPTTYSSGLTAADTFALAALEGLLAAGAKADTLEDRAAAALQAYAVAEAMLAVKRDREGMV